MEKMREIKRLVCVLVLPLLLNTTISAATPEGDLLSSLDLTDEQWNHLSGLLQDYSQKQFALMMEVSSKTAELELEFRRSDRLATDEKAEAGAIRANVLVKEIAALYGRILQTRVAYMLKAKDVLTLEQKVKLIGSLDFEVDSPAMLDLYEELDLIHAGLDLSYDQVRQILRTRTERKVEELKLELRVNLRVLDLEQQLLTGVYQPEKVNTIMMDITQMATEMLTRRVDYFLKTKDILTRTQKQQLLHMLMMVQ